MKTFKFLIILFAALFFTACKKEYSFERGPAVLVTTGSYSLAGSPNSCSNFKVQGIYTVGTALSSSNTVTLQVNVSSIGTYSVATTSNGITFNGAGSFITTGLQNITLQGSGMPATVGNNIIPVIAGTSNCSFNVMVGGVIDPVSINLSDSAWEFNQGTKFHHGYFDGALTNIINGSTVLTLVGLTEKKDTAIAILFNIAGPVVKTGTYKSSASATFLLFDDTGANIYFADNTTAGVELTVVITDYDPITEIVQGTFSGTVFNKLNQVVPVTGGKFKARLNK